MLQISIKFAAQFTKYKQLKTVIKNTSFEYVAAELVFHIRG